MKISELPQAADLTGTELIPIVQGGTTKRSDPAKVKTLANTDPTVKGALLFDEDARKWEDLRVTADMTSEGAIQGGPNPVRMNGMFNATRGQAYSGIGVLNFRNLGKDGGDLIPFWQSCHFAVQLPHAWQMGSRIDPHVHFMLAPSADTAAGKNIFPANQLEAGNIHSGNGGNTGPPSGHWRSAQLIPIEGGEDYTLSFAEYTSQTIRLYWYDSTGAHIGTVNGPTATSPVNASFMRFVISIADEPTQVQLEQNDSATEYEAHSTAVPADPQVGQKLLLEFEYAWLNIRQEAGDTTIETINYTVTQDDIDRRHFLIPFTSIVKEDGGSSSMLWARFSRIRKDPEWEHPVLNGLENDNFEGDFIFLEFDYHYQVGRMGTDVSYPGL